MKKLLLPTILLLLLNCNSDDVSEGPTQCCTEVLVYGLKVIVKDLVTANTITNGITITAEDGEYNEELFRSENSSYFTGAGESEGHYIVEVTSNNYQPFISNLISVEKTEDDCHVITQEIEVLLQPN